MQKISGYIQHLNVALFSYYFSDLYSASVTVSSDTSSLWSGQWIGDIYLAGQEAEVSLGCEMSVKLLSNKCELSVNWVWNECEICVNWLSIVCKMSVKLMWIECELSVKLLWNYCKMSEN